MRNVKYLSPSSIAAFYKDQKEFYLRYLTENRPDNIPQDRPMSIGSAFDAYVKNFMYEGLFGKNHDPKYNFEALFEAQVEEHNRDWALTNGKYVFECYKLSGALSDLMIELTKATNTPRFEFEISGAVAGHREGIVAEIGPMILLGKPDVHFKNHAGFDVILDWKVNGYCSKASPNKGYVKLRDGWIGKPSRSHNSQHKDAFVQMFNGMMCNVAHKLEHVNVDWANQLSIYGWLLGLPVGSEFIVAIDQLACNSEKPGDIEIRIAEHRCTVSEQHQKDLYDKALHVWEVVHSDHIFRDVDIEESKSRCAILDKMAEALIGDGSEQDKLFAKWARQ